MSDIKNIHLQFSCPENRTSLNKIDKGYFCKQCQHLVKDFTCSSKKSLMKTISNTTKPICGMFKRSQLNEKFLKLGVITIAASSIATASHGQSQMIYDSLDKADQYAIGHEYANEVFGIVMDTPAIPVGGYKRFYEAINSELRFPNGQTQYGKLYIQFDVDTLGSMINLEVVKTFSDWAGQEALRVLKKLDYSFKPARQRNKNVKTRMIIPIKFEPSILK